MKLLFSALREVWDIRIWYRNFIYEAVILGT